MSDFAGSSKRMSPLVIGAIGVVYGDIGTSPLYTLRQCFGGEHPVPLTSENVLGLLSIIFWALMIIVTAKYVTLIMRADNRGEGGILALTALVSRGLGSHGRRRWWLVGFGIFGAAMFYGDGMITPAISVLGAVEGLEIIAPELHPFIVPVTVAIVLALFAIQKRGTASVGRLFGPVMCVWFIVLAILGLLQVVEHPGGAGRDRSDPRAFVHRRQSAARLPGAGRRRSRGHRHRGAVRRHGPLRRHADPPRVALVRDAGARAQLFRPGRAAARGSRGDQESVLPAGAAVGADTAGGARDLRGGDRIAGGDLGRVLADARRDPDGILPAAEDPAHVGPADRPDLRPVHQLDAADRGGSARGRASGAPTTSAAPTASR